MPATALELYADLDQELAATRRVLERVPFEHWEWKPHDKSFSLGRLATHLAELPRFAEVIASTDELDMAANPFPTSRIANKEELLALFDGRAETMRQIVASLDAKQLSQNWRLKMGEMVFRRRPDEVRWASQAAADSHPL